MTARRQEAPGRHREPPLPGGGAGMAAWFPYHNEPLDILERHLPPLDATQITWVPPGGRNSIGWILAHLVSTEDFWIHQLAFGTPVGAEPDPSDIRELLRAYRRVRTRSDERLDDCSPADMERIVDVPTFGDGWKPGFPPTVFWVFHHVFEHEMYHIGQISLLLRLAGCEPLPF